MSEEEPVQLEISDVFDLHAFSPRDLKAAVEAYLEEAHRLSLEPCGLFTGAASECNVRWCDPY